MTSGTSGGRNASRSVRSREVQPSLVVGIRGGQSRGDGVQLLLRALERRRPASGGRTRTASGVCAGRRRRSASSGTQSRWFFGNANPGGITPTIVWGRALMWIVRPRTFGILLVASRPQVVADQHDAAPRPADRPRAVKPWPMIGAVPSIGNKSQDIAAPS